MDLQASDSVGVEQHNFSILPFMLQYIGRRKAVILLGMAGIMSVLDLFSIAIIFPYLEVVASTSSRAEKSVVDWLSVTAVPLDHRDLVIVLSAALVILYAVKSAIQVLLTRYQLKQLSQLTATITDDMVSRILGASYATFQETAGSELAGVVYSNTVHVTVATQALIQALNDSLFLGLLLIAFFIAQPGFALASIAVVGLACAAPYLGLIRRTTFLGNSQSRIENLRYRLLFSIVTAIRDIKIMGLDGLFAVRNREISTIYADIGWRTNLNAALPRFIIELIVLTGLVAIAATYVMLQVSIEKIAPLLGLTAIASVRTIPAFTRLIGSINTYRFSKPVVERLITIRTKLALAATTLRDDSLSFKRMIELRNVAFRYGTMQTLKNVNMTIQQGQSIGIVGPSGAGKTTLLDLITGLQPATEGEFRCDGELFDPFTSRSTRKMIGYVPQSITLLDESIAFNIAFEHQPSPDRLMRALRVANLEKYVASLPEGVETPVGENGLRLSGGQRQRVGIARAMYREPMILVFDEATNSLDTISERELTAEIAQLRGAVTMIIVTHRLSTIADCDCIYVLSKGAIIDSGTHEELLSRCHLYRQMSIEQEESKTPPYYSGASAKN